MKTAQLSLFALSLFAPTLTAAPALAQEAGPEPLPMPAPTAAPQDTPYPGVIRLQVDATDTDRHVFRVHESIPVTGGGPITLFYPKWLPGNHSPTGQIFNLAGLIAHAGGQRVEWRRDPVDVFAFHFDVPDGAASLDLDFQYVSPVTKSQGRVVMTTQTLNLQWNLVALYPAGHFTRKITFEPSVTLPEGWKFGTALEPASSSGASVTFKPVDFGTLVDSPMFAGRNFKQVELDPGGPAPVRMDIVADQPDQLEISADQLQAHRNLVQQAYKLYGSHHYDHYDFLVALSDEMSGIGLEHHRSSEDGTDPDYFKEWDKLPSTRDLLPHEYTHSWNGKFRRGADLWTPDFNTPMRDSLLWVYEGQTQYWGYVLAARSGLLTRQQALDAIANVAAIYSHRIGREWKTLQDTTNDPIVAMRRSIPWTSWQRSEDYYSEGELIWLDADTRIRELSKGKRSLDDFAKAFFGVDNGSWETRTYDFDEVVRTLNSVQPYDWAAFLRERLQSHGPGAPLDGVTRGGYRLVYTEAPTDYFRLNEARRKILDLSWSLGFTVNTKDNSLSDVIWDGPAFKAGLTQGTSLVAVGGLAYSAERLKEAVTAAKAAGQPVELLVKNGDRYRTVRVDYHDGLRYPHLQRIEGTPARLDDILAPRK